MGKRRKRIFKKDKAERKTKLPVVKTEMPFSFRKHLLRTLGVILGVSLLSFLLSQMGLLRGFEMAALDVWLRLKVNIVSSPSPDILIVDIDESDYQYMFGGRSPLNHERVLELVNAIAEGKPRVAGVDIDTSGPEYAGAQLPQVTVPIVWQRSAEYREDLQKYELHTVLSDMEPPLSGIAQAIRDTEDGVVRQYCPAFDTDKGPMPSFARAMAQTYNVALVNNPGDANDELFLKFSSGRDGFPRQRASTILELSKGQGWKENSIIRDKIVILGGSYRAARDRHFTPLGLMQGVEIVAHTVETELEGGGVKPPHKLIQGVFDLVGGLTIMLLHQRFRIGKAILLSLMAIPILALVFSIIPFSHPTYWIRFVVVLIAVLIFELYDNAKKYQNELVKRLYEQAGKQLSKGA